MSSPENSPLKPNKGNPEQSQSKSSWVEKLAQRSTGLPGSESKPVPEDRAGNSSLWRLAGIGVNFALTIALFAFMGHAADNRWHTSPWMLVTLTVIAVVGNLYLLIKETMREDSPSKNKKT